VAKANVANVANDEAKNVKVLMDFVVFNHSLPFYTMIALILIISSSLCIGRKRAL